MFTNAKKIFYFQQYFVIRLGEKTYDYNPKNNSFALLRAFFSLLRHAFKADSHRDGKQKTLKRFKYLIYVETINQKNAIIDVFNQAEKNDFLFIVNNSIEVPNFDNSQFPNKKAFLKALWYLPKAYCISQKYRASLKGRISGGHILVNLALFMASAALFEEYFKETQCDKVILTNDHNLQPLALLYAAKKAGIKSYYIQHASVSEAFPKLLPDVALLEGNQAVDTYKIIGNLSRKQELVGIARMDGLLGYKNEICKTDRVVGLCLKPYYSEALIRELILNIRRSEAVSKIILRPHPGNNADFYAFLKGFNIEISNAKLERPHEFIKQLDVMISGESSIILEAALMKVKTLYIDDKVAQFDLYGFVKNGVTEALPSVIDLAKVLSQPDLGHDTDKYYQNCRYYCSTVNTDYQNRSKELILKNLLTA